MRILSYQRKKKLSKCFYLNAKKYLACVLNRMLMSPTSTTSNIAPNVIIE